MKYLFVGDIHNHSYMFNDIERLDKEYKFDRIIFVGDYVDDWGTTNHESLETLDKVIELKRSNENKYTFLFGNHELSYLGYPCSGHQYELDDIVKFTLIENIDCFNLYTIAECGDKEVYCSHAGFTNKFITNDLGIYWKETLDIINTKPLNYLELFTKCSGARGGYSDYSSCLWADVREHVEANHFEKPIIPYQVIGHSPVNTIGDIRGKDYLFWFIDTHSTYADHRPIGDQSYLIWDENEFKTVK